MRAFSRWEHFYRRLRIIQTLYAMDPWGRLSSNSNRDLSTPLVPRFKAQARKRLFFMAVKSDSNSLYRIEDHMVWRMDT
uniref:(California timema) hypothetical protein n=1 Tax=Timema californicum TaxID=61474 RepID=A0A7R9J366_TIMCA|nr:unnamed protein product [Timema californicum]